MEKGQPMTNDEMWKRIAKYVRRFFLLITILANIVGENASQHNCSACNLISSNSISCIKSCYNCPSNYVSHLCSSRATRTTMMRGYMQCTYLPTADAIFHMKNARCNHKRQYYVKLA